MSGFISRAACRGRRPLAFTTLGYNERPAPISLLLKNRDVARFIVAPDGYGKTTLAVEYAETMFGWVHVFWVNAKSPCFIRDLDAGALASGCFSSDQKPALVVFDDLPALDSERAHLFSDEIDTLLAERCEVLVTSVPSCRLDGSFQRDRLQVGALDLLLDDTELDRIRSIDERSRVPVDAIGPSQRVPALCWGRDADDVAMFARSVFSEELPADVMLLMASILVLRLGALSDLRGIISVDREVFEDIAGDYPHLGIGADLERFDAPFLDISILASPLKGRIRELASRSLLRTPADLVFAWSRLLMDARKQARACDLVREVCVRSRRAEWLSAHAYELIRSGCFFPTLRIALDRDSAKGEVRMRLGAIEAFCRRMLGDEEGALRCVKRHAFDDQAPFDVRVFDLVMAARLGMAPLADQARRALSEIAETGEAEGERGRMWLALAKAACASATGSEELAGEWRAQLEAGMEQDVLCVIASWFFGKLDAPAQFSVDGRAALRAIEHYVRECLKASESGPASFFAASAGLSMEEAHMRGVEYEEGPLDASVLVRLRQSELAVLSQRRLFGEFEHAALARRNDWNESRSAALSEPAGAKPTQRERVVPTLKVRLFGSFEVSIGDTPVEQSRFRRKNSRILLVMLAINQGRDVSREAISATMWPGSTEEVGRKNFYTVWSELRRALSLPDGTCPYLARHQFGCNLISHHVESDVSRLKEICREFMFGTPNIELWSRMFAEVDRDFSCDLMPSENKNPLVLNARAELRTRLIDSLVAATLSVIDADSPQWGIWFARKALFFDETREDAYVALMRAQVSFNQRTAAMATYLRCRRVLADRLGIDPSPEVTRLYESLLDSDE